MTRGDGEGHAGERLDLRSEQIGARPLIRPLIARLKLRDFFRRAFGRPDPRLKLPHVDSALLLVCNIVLSRYPLYGVAQWARRFEGACLELSEGQLSLINDDRLGRTLDTLFLVDRATLMTQLIVHMVEEFGIELARIHNDSTSVTCSGEYREPPPRADGRKRPRIVHGYNKDHRPDLKQLVWTLSITADGGVPIHYNVDDGNMTDDQTHRRTWDILREIAGTPHFIYTADSKLCTRTNMAHIAGKGGWFITVLPRTRKEDAAFKRWIAAHPVPWEVVWERPPMRRRGDPPDVYEAYDAPEQLTAEGYRLIWFRSSEKWKRDEQARQQAIEQARFQLHQLGDKVGRRKLKERSEVQAAVDQILTAIGAGAWVRVELVARPRHSHKQQGPGRPGKNTRYRRVTTTVWEPVVSLNHEAIRASAQADGIFPLVTNLGREPQHDVAHSALQILQIYKYQPVLEKRHEQLKTAAEVVPVNFKDTERIDAFLFLFFIAITIHALLERQLRKAMVAHRIESIPIYPEQRACKKPTADKILALFAPQRRHLLFEGGHHIKTFWDPITDTQRAVLELLDLPMREYGADGR